MRARPSEPPAARGGFTLVEVLVAAALAIVIMYVLAAAFAAATDTLSRLKSVGGLADQLRTASTLLIRDLGDVHLEDANGDPVRVSNIPADDPTTPLPNDEGAWLSPRRGFFRVVQGPRVQSAAPTPPALPIDEGTDGEGVRSVRTTNDWLAFTVRRSGVSDDVFVADVPVIRYPAPAAPTDAFAALRSQSLAGPGSAPQFVSRWAEVSYFLRPSGATTSADTDLPLPLYTLYRRVRVLAPSARPGLPTAAPNPGSEVSPSAAAFNVPPYNVPPPPPVPLPADLSWSGRPVLVDATGTAVAPSVANTIFPNTPESVTVPPVLNTALPSGNRQPTTVATNATPYLTPVPIRDLADPYRDADRAGSDILLSNVVSMQVEVMTAAVDFGDMAAIPADDPNAATDGRALVFDTADTNLREFQENDPSPQERRRDGPPGTPVPRPRLRAVRVKLRVYDIKNQVTRQVTVAQAL